MGKTGESSGTAPAVAVAAAWAWLSLPSESLLKQCLQARFQGSGPGGQKRNRVYSGVRLTHPASGLSAESVDSRASARNLGEALSRLRLAIALAAAPADPAEAGNDPEKDPGNAAVTKAPGHPADPAPATPFRAGANPSHPDYARGALRALSLLRFHAGQLAPAAAALGCTPSALTRYLKEEKAVWARAREIRIGKGLHPLK
ncbi:MAG: peptide chain release factor-like protein [Fibrobacteres bacterium]|jgi:hypothetical protein|nr:peptide chain release factor-like protein [Fibrobacterota bacterium]